MLISDEDFIILEQEFKDTYPYIYISDPPPTDPPTYPQFEESAISTSLRASVESIPNHCRKWKEIAFALTIHSLLQQEQEKQKYQSGDTAIEKDLQSVKALGDLSTTYQKPTSYEKFNPLYDTDAWGQKAKLLLKECTKGRVGIIV